MRFIHYAAVRLQSRQTLRFTPPRWAQSPQKTPLLSRVMRGAVQLHIRSSACGRWWKDRDKWRGAWWWYKGFFVQSSKKLTMWLRSCAEKWTEDVIFKQMNDCVFWKDIQHIINLIIIPTDSVLLLILYCSGILKFCRKFGSEPFLKIFITKLTQQLIDF